jgi:hypothetical protein
VPRVWLLARAEPQPRPSSTSSSPPFVPRRSLFGKSTSRKAVERPNPWDSDAKQTPTKLTDNSRWNGTTCEVTARSDPCHQPHPRAFHPGPHEVGVHMQKPPRSFSRSRCFLHLSLVDLRNMPQLRLKAGCQQPHVRCTPFVPTFDP